MAAGLRWLQAEDEPLNVGTLRMPAPAEAALRRAFTKHATQLGQRSLYCGFEQYRELVEQVLSRDIRSHTQRIKVPQRAQQGGPAALCSSGSGQGAAPVAAAAAQQQDAAAAGRAGTADADMAGVVQQQHQEGFWKVVLDGIQVSYDVEEGSSNVVVRTARLATAADA